MLQRFYQQILVIIILCRICNAQEMTWNNNCSKESNCSASAGCIWKYKELESYILNSPNIVDRLTETFFQTSGEVAMFVRITYNAQIMKSYNYTTGNTSENCTSHNTKYIWSESPLYLLGPAPLFWFTLFAINVPETSVVVDLPCLCSDAYNSLLSRLTYLIKVYSVPNYSSRQFVEFKNPNYFHTKTANLKDITIMDTIPSQKHPSKNPDYLNNTLITKTTIKEQPLKSSSSASDSPPNNDEPDSFEINALTDTPTTKLTVEGHGEPDTPTTKPTMNGNDEIDFVTTKITIKGQHVKNTIIASALATNVTITIALFIFHIISDVTYIQYGNEVLYNRDVDDSDYSSNSDDQALPIYHTVFSLLTMIMGTILYTIGYVLISWCDNKTKENDAAYYNLHISLPLVISVNIIYLGSYFAPYMLLAIIHDPIQTGFVYICLVMLVVGYFSVFFGLFILFGDYLCWEFKDVEANEKPEQKAQKALFGFCICFASWTGLASIACIVTAIVFIFTFGSINNFQQLQNLVFPSILGLLSVIFLKFGVGHIKNHLTDQDQRIPSNRDCECGRNDSSHLQNNEHNMSY
ncbi:uncharacterized protein [Dysidea avara]|uniref:uncharacterized protein isoform X2 n=1 Tax=Dysidea avara TaxID=196820 RepID=UPI003329F25D